MDGTLTYYRIFAERPNWVMDLQIDAVLGVFQRGLLDQESPGESFWILDAFLLYGF